MPVEVFDQRRVQDVLLGPARHCRVNLQTPQKVCFDFHGLRCDLRRLIIVHRAASPAGLLK